MAIRLSERRNAVSTNRTVSYEVFACKFRFTNFHTTFLEFPLGAGVAQVERLMYHYPLDIPLESSPAVYSCREYRARSSFPCNTVNTGTELTSHTRDASDNRVDKTSLACSIAKARGRVFALGGGASTRGEKSWVFIHVDNK